MNWLTWKNGRRSNENGLYQKILLLSSSLFKFDVYLLKYPPNCVLDWHIDSVPDGFEHHRINITLIGKGSFSYSSIPFYSGTYETRPNFSGISKWNGLLGSYYLTNKKFIKFRPDIFEHKFVNGNRETIKLSIGWLRRIRKIK